MRTQSTTSIGPCAQTCRSSLATLGFRALALIWPQGWLGRHLAAEVDKASSQVVWSSSCEFGPAPRSRVTALLAMCGGSGTKMSMCHRKGIVKGWERQVWDGS